MLKILVALLVVTLLSPIAASAAPEHADLTAILKAHVSNGMVNYSKLKEDGRLDDYLKKLQSTKTGSLKGKSKMAFWINAYNAFTLKLIVDNWPVKSIRDLEGGKVWDKKWIKIDGKTYSLNHIENKIIRPIGDARIHYALVCAAKGCPPLRNEAYEAGALSRQLTEQAKSFVRNGSGHDFSSETKTAKLSQLYKWYASDFGKGTAGLIKHVAQYAPSKVAKAMRASTNSWKVEYVNYDWSINGK